MNVKTQEKEKVRKRGRKGDLMQRDVKMLKKKKSGARPGNRRWTGNRKGGKRPERKERVGK